MTYFDGQNSPFFGWILKDNPTFWEDNGFEKVNTFDFHYYGCIYAKANNLPVYRKQLYIDYDMEEDSAVEVFPIEPGSVCHTYLMAIHTWNNAGGCKFSLDLVCQVSTIDAFNNIIMEHIGNNLDGGSYLLTINGLDI